MNWFFRIAIGAVLALGFWASDAIDRSDKECKKRGGVVIQTRAGNACVRRDAVISTDAQASRKPQR